MAMYGSAEGCCKVSGGKLINEISLAAIGDVRRATCRPACQTPRR